MKVLYLSLQNIWWDSQNTQKNYTTPLPKKQTES